MPVRLTVRTRLVDLRNEAKALWHALELGDAQAMERARKGLQPDEWANLSLVVCQNVIAREYGCANWGRLKHRLAQLAQGFHLSEGDPAAQAVAPDEPDAMEPDISNEANDS